MADLTLTTRRIESLKTDRGQEDFRDAMIPGFGIRVSGKSRTKTFFVRYTLKSNGKPTRPLAMLGQWPVLSLADARKKAIDIKTSASHGIDIVEEERLEEDAATLGEFWPAFMGSKDLSPRTVKHYESIYRRYVEPTLGHRTMRTVKRSDVAEALGSIESPAVHNHARSLILNLWNAAIGLGFGDVEMNPAYKFTKKKEAGRFRKFSTAELRQLWIGFDSIAPVDGAAMKVILLTAQRMGQVTRMRWADIEGPTWKCPAEFTKGKRDTWVPLSKATLEVIEEMRGLDPVWIFPAGRDDSEVGHRGSLSHAFKRMVDAEEIPDAGLHDLRTTFNSIAKAPKEGDVAIAKGLGFNSDVSAACLSHKPDALEYDRYTDNEGRAAHLIAQRRELLDAWADYLEANEVIRGAK